MTRNDRRPCPRLWLISSLCTFVGIAAACGPPRPDDDGTSADDHTPIPDLGNGDKWNCGDLGVSCVGPLGIGDCIDGQCQPRLGHQCYSPAWTPTCDDYCIAEGSTCAADRCSGVTAWGWPGDQTMGDILCTDGDRHTAFPLDVACDEPLEGLATTLRCCCEFP